MPTDKAGKFHLSSQRAMASDKAGDSKGITSAPPASGEENSEGTHQDTGVHEHLAAMHAQSGGKHMHVHSDGMTHTTHHVGEDGEVQGPHNHENIEALKDHLGKFFDEEANEWSGEDYHKSSAAAKDGY